MTKLSKIQEGIYRVRLESDRGGVGHVNTYLIEMDEGRYVCVDSGFRETAGEMIKSITEELGEGVVIEKLVITHLHYDHYGGTNEIAKRFNPEVLCHEKEKEVAGILERIMRSESRDILSNYMNIPGYILEKIIEIVNKEISNLPKIDNNLYDGMVISSTIGKWRIVHTPGHTPGHVCLFNEENRILISGDHLLPEETSNVAYYPLDDYNPLLLYLKSLRLVEKMNPLLILPSHGEVFTDASKRVDELFRHHRTRLREVFEGIRKGEGDVITIAKNVSWSRGMFDKLELFDKWLAILETISHAEFLRWCGLVERGENRLSYRIAEDDAGRIDEVLFKIS